MNRTLNMDSGGFLKDERICVHDWAATTLFAKCARIRDLPLAPCPPARVIKPPSFTTLNAQTVLHHLCEGLH